MRFLSYSFWLFVISYWLLSIGSTFPQHIFSTTSARSAGMGNAFISIPGDPVSIIENPAALSFIRSQQALLTCSYQSYDFNSKNFSQIDGSFFLAQHNFGLNVTLKEKGDRKNKIKRVIPQGDSTGPYSLKNRELSLFVSSSERLSSGVAIGLSIQYMRIYTDAWTQTGEINDKDGFAGHIGLFYPFSGGSFGATLTNLYFKKLDYILYDDYGNVEFFDSAPLNLNAGISFYPRDGILFSFDVKNIIEREVKEKNTPRIYRINPSFHAGTEITLQDSLKLRFGIYRNQTYSLFPQNFIWRNTVTSGIGYESSGFSLDFSVNYDERERDMFPKPTRTLQYILSLGRKM